MSTSHGKSVVGADAMVVLGCRVLANGQPSAALARRIRLAQRAFAAGVSPRLVASGGRLWHGVAEAECMALALSTHAASAVVEERCSLNTMENAYFCAQWLRARGLHKVMLCTCAWHFGRASKHFERYGIEVRPPPLHWYEAARVPWWRPLRERVTGALERRFLALIDARTGQHKPWRQQP